ncbi:MAG TPA: 2-phosphosulfolactate phosphatase [Longimicrobium sp.]|nr:2-phosphosulfolactate phosphatase [Longimicrobium sp.]
MRLDVLLTPGEVLPADVAGRTVVVVDVLRATSTIVEALASGVRTIYPVASIEEALRLANTLGREAVLLSGERKALPIEGFDLGNSPRDFTPEKVGGKTLIISTTNGTAVMAAAQSASRIVIGSFLNLSAVVADLARGGSDPVLVCAGREGKFGLEDAVFAGRVAKAVMEASPDAEWELNDGARAALALVEPYADLEALFRATAAGKQIADAGLEEDLPFCAQVDRHDLVPVLHDRQISAAAATAATAATTD